MLSGIPDMPEKRARMPVWYPGHHPLTRPFPRLGPLLGSGHVEI